MSFLDNSQTWTDRPDNCTALNVVASNADSLIDYKCADILHLLLKELSHYIQFERGRSVPLSNAPADQCR
jgi:hypothetical protein